MKEKLGQYLDACFSGVWLQSAEHEDAIQEVADLCRQRDWKLACWDIASGLSMNGSTDPDMKDPLAILASAGSMRPEGEESVVLLLRNYHRFLDSAEIVQEMCRQIEEGKRTRTFVVVLSPVVKVPAELEKHFIVLEHDLPTREQLQEVAQGIATEEGEMPEGADLEKLLDASAGLTRMEAEGAFSLSLVRDGKLSPASVWELKAGTLKKSGLLNLYRGGESFADLGGLDSLKAFCKRALARSHGKVRPKGVMLLSPPGCGKSAFCKALGNETGRPTLVLDVGALMGSLVGQSEANMRQALKVIDAMAPCVVMVDEVEKAMAGATGPSGDSGVASRLFGTFLSWLNDHETDVFVVCTANDISRLPPEFSRSERFDGVFFVDLPDREAREAIWGIYHQVFGIEAQEFPVDEGWTGAEIKSCCRLSALLDVPLTAAAQNVVPVSVTSAESVEALRAWAAGRCLSADNPGVYQRAAQPQVRRGIQRGPTTSPSDN